MTIEHHLRGMDDDYLLSMYERNQDVLTVYEYNAARMRDILDQMKAEINKRGLNG